MDLIAYSKSQSFNIVYRDFELYLPLVCCGKKNGLRIGFYDVDVDTIVSSFTNLGFSIKYNPPNPYVNSDKIMDVYVTTQSNVNLLESVSYNTEDFEYGKFLGVPDEDNTWFTEASEERIREVQPVSHYVGYSNEDIRYARVIPWLCKPTLERLTNTIDIGRNWFNFSVSLEHKFGYSNAREYCEDRHNCEDHSFY